MKPGVTLHGPFLVVDFNNRGAVHTLAIRVDHITIVRDYPDGAVHIATHSPPQTVELNGWSAAGILDVIRNGAAWG